MEFVLFLIAILPVVLGVINIKLTRGFARKLLIGVMVIAYGIFGLLLVLNIVSNNITDRDSKDYSIDSGTILGGIYLLDVDDDYVYINKSYLFGSESFVVSASNCEVSPLAYLSRSIKVYHIGQRDYESMEQVVKDGFYYNVDDSIVKIMPDFWTITFAYALVGTIVMLAFNGIFLIACLIKRAVDKRKMNYDLNT